MEEKLEREKIKGCFEELWKACFVSENIEEIKQAFKEVTKKYGKEMTCKVAGHLLERLKEKQKEK